MTAIDDKSFRDVLGHYPTGVCVVSAVDQDGGLAGMVVGSFTSVSLSPPLVAFLPAKSSTSWPRIESAGRFCVNVLAGDQLALCQRFSAKNGDKFDGVSHRLSENGSPVLDHVIAWIDCTPRRFIGRVIISLSSVGLVPRRSNYPDGGGVSRPVS